MKPTYEEWLRKLVEAAPYGTKGRLAIFMGIDSTKMSRILSGQRKISIREMERAAEFFGVPVPVESLPNAKIGHELEIPAKLIPVYGRVVGGIDSDFIMNGEVIDEVQCPPALAGSTNPYAVFVFGDSMEPRYYSGELVYVNPDLRFKKGDFVVVQIADRDNPGGAPKAYVKQFVRWNDKVLVLHQFNPSDDLQFPSEDVISIHLIVLGGSG